MLAYLMFKDSKIAKLDIDSYGFRLLESYSSIFPVRSSEEIHRWWSARQTPYARDNIMDVYKYLGIRTFEDFVRITHFCSINDCWWVKTSDSQNWSSINLFSNSFNKFVSDMCITGDIGVPSNKGFIYSPEFSLGGTFPKTWKHVKGDVYLLKGSRLQRDRELNNSFIYSEVLVNQLQEFLGFDNYVKYRLGKYKDIDVCYCRCFTNEKVMFYPAIYYLYEGSSYEKVKKVFGSYINFYQMCLLDYLTFNVDRHTGNFGFLVSSEDFSIIGMSPIFDNNCSLLPTKAICNLDKNKLSQYCSSLVTRFDDMSFDELGSHLCEDFPISSEICEAVYKSFRFKPVRGLNRRRLDRLSYIVKMQALKLLRR